MNERKTMRKQEQQKNIISTYNKSVRNKHSLEGQGILSSKANENQLQQV